MSKRRIGERAVCRYCGQDIEWTGSGKWRDRGGNRSCVAYESRSLNRVVRPRTKHAPGSEALRRLAYGGHTRTRAGTARLTWRRSGGGTGWYGYFPGDPERGYLLRRRKGVGWAVHHMGRMLGVARTLAAAKKDAWHHAVRQP